MWFDKWCDTLAAESLTKACFAIRCYFAIFCRYRIIFLLTSYKCTARSLQSLSAADELIVLEFFITLITMVDLPMLDQSISTKQPNIILAIHRPKQTNVFKLKHISCGSSYEAPCRNAYTSHQP